MAKPALNRFFTLGIDLGNQSTSAAASTTLEVLELLDRYQQPATWATEDVTVAAVDSIRSKQLPHEIALMLPQNSSPRGDLEHLRQQLRAATQSDLELRSVVCSSERSNWLELAARIGFRTVRALRSSPAVPYGAVQPLALRYGLWTLPVSCYLPRSGNFVEHFVMRHALAGLRTAMDRGQAYHVVLDIATLCLAGSSGLQHVERLLRTVVELRQAEKLTTARLSDVSRLVQLSLVSQPTRSILRRAA